MVEFVVNPETGRVIRKDGQVYRRWRRAHPTAPEPPTVPPNHRRGVSRHPAIDTHHHHQHVTAPIHPARRDSRRTSRDRVRCSDQSDPYYQPAPLEERFSPQTSPRTHRYPYMDETYPLRDVSHCTTSTRGIDSPTKLVTPRLGSGARNDWCSETPPMPSLYRTRSVHPPPLESATNTTTTTTPTTTTTTTTKACRHEAELNDDDDDDDDYDGAETRLIHRLLNEHGPALLEAYLDPHVDFMQALLAACQLLLPVDPRYR